MRLELTRKTDLAVHAMRAMDDAEGRLTGRQLAELIGTTTPFMSQVVAPLVKKGWVDSRPGPTGGYALCVAPATISFLDVIEAIEGPLDTGMCILAGGPCGDEDLCSLHDAWVSACEALRRSFAAIPVYSGD